MSEITPSTQIRQRQDLTDDAVGRGAFMPHDLGGFARLDAHVERRRPPRHAKGMTSHGGQAAFVFGLGARSGGGLEIGLANATDGACPVGRQVLECHIVVFSRIVDPTADLADVLLVHVFPLFPLNGLARQGLPAANSRQFTKNAAGRALSRQH